MWKSEQQLVKNIIPLGQIVLLLQPTSDFGPEFHWMSYYIGLGPLSVYHLGQQDVF